MNAVDKYSAATVFCAGADAPDKPGATRNRIWRGLLMRFMTAAAALVCSAMLPAMGHAADNGAGNGGDIKWLLWACTQDSDPGKRLQCFDRVAAGTVPRPANQAKGRAATRWEVTAGKSAIDDSRGVTAVLPAASVTGGSFDDMALILVARCEESKIAVYVAANEYLGTEATQAVVRMGTAPARNEQWHASTDGTAMGLWGGGMATAFVREIEANLTMTVRLISFDGTQYTGDFNLDGVGEALGQVLAACPDKAAGGGL